MTFIFDVDVADECEAVLCFVRENIREHIREKIMKKSLESASESKRWEDSCAHAWAVLILHKSQCRPSPMTVAIRNTQTPP